MAHTFSVDPAPIQNHYRNVGERRKPWHEHSGVSSKMSGRIIHATQAVTLDSPAPLMGAAGYAWNGHLPLVITPDSVWLTILLGLSHAIDESPDALRGHFVNHDGKKEIRFRGAGTLESQNWDGHVVPYFASQIASALTEQCKSLFPCDFSTTTEVDRLASHVVMMGAMRHWFDYRMSLACAITEVTVTGTIDDWRRIIRRVGSLGDMGLAWWSDHLMPVLLDILSSCAGSPKHEFWRRIYKRHGYGSGGQFRVSGWINTLHPFIAGRGGKMARNPNVDWTRGGETHGEDFPTGLASCEIIVDDNGRERTAMLYGGLVGVGLSESLAVQAVSGYAVTVL